MPVIHHHTPPAVIAPLGSSSASACGPNSGCLPIPSILSAFNYNFAVSVMLAAPPCGTPEAKASPTCLNWVVVPCPSRPQQPSRSPLLDTVGRPIGCP